MCVSAVLIAFDFTPRLVSFDEQIKSLLSVLDTTM